MGVSDWRAHGLAAGLAGSGVASAQVAAPHPRSLAAASSALGISLYGLPTSLLAPMLLHWSTLVR